MNPDEESIHLDPSLQDDVIGTAVSYDTNIGKYLPPVFL